MEQKEKNSLMDFFKDELKNHNLKMTLPPVVIYKQLLSQQIALLQRICSIK